MILYLALLSIIPQVDKFVTRGINKINIHKISQLYSDWVVYFNILINFLYLLKGSNYSILIYRYFIELIIINVVFKCFLDRSRPYKYFLKNKRYDSVFDIKLSNNWLANQSFPSGHVATLYCTYYILESFILKKIYFYLIILVIFSRINLGKHYFSDCICSILICKICYYIRG